MDIMSMVNLAISNGALDLVRGKTQGDKSGNPAITYTGHASGTAPSVHDIFGGAKVVRQEMMYDANTGQPYIVNHKGFWGDGSGGKGMSWANASRQTLGNPRPSEIGGIPYTPFNNLRGRIANNRNNQNSLLRLVNQKKGLVA